MQNLTQKKIKSYVGFAVKSGNIIFGADNVIRPRKKMYIVLITDSINQTSFKKVTAFAEREKIPLITVNDEIMDTCVKKNNCKCIAITDKNLAKAIKDSLLHGGATNE